MIPYFLLFIAFIPLIFFRCYKIILLILVIFSSLRFDVGMDWIYYNDAFNSIRLNHDINEYNRSFEPANTLVINFLSLFSASNFIIFAFYSSTTIILIHKYIKYFSCDYFFSIFLFTFLGVFYLSTFNGIRQWVALSICFYSLTYLSRSCFFKYFLFILLASLFHYSALIFIILFPFLYFRHNFNFIIILLTLYFLSLNIVIELLSHTHYSIYFEKGLYSNHPNILLLFIFVALNCSYLYFLGYFKNNNHLTRGDVILLNISLFSLLLFFTYLYIDIDFISFQRISTYFLLQNIIFIPRIIFKLSPNSQIQTVIKYIIFLTVSFMYFYLIIFKGFAYNIVPYRTYLEDFL